MSTNHTPGPWYQSKRLPSSIIAAERHDPDFIDTGEERTIAAYGGVLVAETVAPQNVPLIAAAPDLLRACLLALAHYIAVNTDVPSANMHEVDRALQGAIAHALNRIGISNFASLSIAEIMDLADKATPGADT